MLLCESSPLLRSNLLNDLIDYLNHFELELFLSLLVLEHRLLSGEANLWFKWRLLANWCALHWLRWWYDQAANQADEFLNDHRDGGTLTSNLLWDDIALEAFNGLLVKVLESGILSLYILFVLESDTTLSQGNNKPLGSNLNVDWNNLVGIQIFLGRLKRLLRQWEMLSNSLLIWELLLLEFFLDVGIDLNRLKLSLVSFL